MSGDPYEFSRFVEYASPGARGSDVDADIGLLHARSRI
jgi:hypothetical protein